VPEPVPQRPLRVLVVDDSAVLRVRLQRAVERLGHVCKAADDGITALEVFKTFQPEVVISDWEMPRMDGLELCRSIRELAAEPYPYFIFLTALDQRENILSAMGTGADDYLEKPLDPLELAAALLGARRVSDLHASLREQRIALQSLNERLHDDARRDPLTGMRNRLQLREDLDELVATFAEKGACVAICDVDFFKNYNDHNGHQAGDQVLAAVAATIGDVVRASDSVYRYGGEEFLVLLPGASLDAGAAAVERIRAAVEASAVVHPDSTVSDVVTISCGVAFTHPTEPAMVHDCLRRADDALYAAKAAGRNRVQRALPFAPAAAA
jgi:two-component system, cell cycle response regulator